MVFKSSRNKIATPKTILFAIGRPHLDLNALTYLIIPSHVESITIILKTTQFHWKLMKLQVFSIITTFENHYTNISNRFEASTPTLRPSIIWIATPSPWSLYV